MAKRLALLRAMVLVSVVVVSGCGGGGGTASAPSAGAADATAGKAVFDQNCNGCHPGGGPGVGLNLKGTKLTAQQIQDQVRKGKGQMPAFPESKISEKQLNDLVAHVQSLK